ncbi:MAG: hypothetical protein U9O53_05785 [archaeon]|nr:hypothetical protein [archaeon]
MRRDVGNLMRTAVLIVPYEVTLFQYDRIIEDHLNSGSGIYCDIDHCYGVFRSVIGQFDIAVKVVHHVIVLKFIDVQAFGIRIAPIIQDMVIYRATPYPLHGIIYLVVTILSDVVKHQNAFISKLLTGDVVVKSAGGRCCIESSQWRKLFYLVICP